MNKSELIHKIESYIPKNVITLYRKYKRFILWKLQQYANTTAIHKLKSKKEPINVIFLALYASVWKYDSVYKLLEHDKRFNPLILVCPIMDVDENHRRMQQELAISRFKQCGYKVLSAYDESKKKLISLKKFSPDIVFFCSCWNHSGKEYDVHHLRRYLKCYVSYGYCNTNGTWGYASSFHGLMWKYFCENKLNQLAALDANKVEMQNTVVTGYPMFDEYQAAEGETYMWKNADPSYKRIIWAPHHSIASRSLVNFSTFIENAQEMLNIAHEFEDNVQFVFKPHPQLLDALYNDPDWGKEKADEYYQRWADGRNTAIATGEYMDLFKSSDAMIHDCGSFIVEYLYTQKPVLYLSYGNRESQSNETGKLAYACHYHGQNANDIRHFIQDIVLDGKDPLYKERNEFYQTLLVPPNNMSVAENIINEITKELHI